MSDNNSDNNTELKALRDLREINLAIKDLETQASVVSKKFKLGVRLLQRESSITENHLEDGYVMDGCESWNVRHEKIRNLINDPKLDNIPEDSSV